MDHEHNHMDNHGSHGLHQQHDCGGGGEGGHVHSMVFSFGIQATPMLLKGFSVGPDFFSFFSGCVLVVMLGVARAELVRKSEQETSLVEVRAAYYFAQATLAYLLMLLAMTFNAFLFLAVILGLTLGHYRMLRLGLKPKEECCS